MHTTSLNNNGVNGKHIHSRQEPNIILTKLIYEEMVDMLRRMITRPVECGLVEGCQILRYRASVSHVQFVDALFCFPQPKTNAFTTFKRILELFDWYGIQLLFLLGFLRIRGKHGVTRSWVSQEGWATHSTKCLFTNQIADILAKQGALG